jgi:hypothetical protein
MNFHFMYLLIFRTELDFFFVFVFFLLFLFLHCFHYCVYLSCDKNNIMEHVVSMPIPLSWNDICEIFFCTRKVLLISKGVPNHRQYYGHKKLNQTIQWPQETKPQTIIWPQEPKPDNTMATRNQTTDNTMATRN